MNNCESSMLKKIKLFTDILLITFACVKSNGYICSVILE